MDSNSYRLYLLLRVHCFYIKYKGTVICYLTVLNFFFQLAEKKSQTHTLMDNDGLKRTDSDSAQKSTCDVHSYRTAK